MLFVLLTNLVYTAVVLPINSLALLRSLSSSNVGFIMFVCCRHEFMSLHGHFCSIFAITYFWVVAAILFVQGAIAVNRWAIVCTQKYRYRYK